MSVVLLGGLDNYLIKVAHGLIERGVSVTHFLDRYQWPASRQGGLGRINSIDARQFTVPEQIMQLNQNTGPLLSAALLQNFAKAELVWLAVSDRYTQTMSVTQRRRLFRALLEYFYRWVSQEKVQAIIFPNVPHAGWNNVLYFVAKHLEITTLILEPTRLNDRVMLWDDYEHVDKVPPDFFPAATASDMQAHINADLLAELITDSSWMTVSDDINKNALKKSTSLGEIASLVRALVRGAVHQQRPRDLLFDKPWGFWAAHWRRYLLQRRARHLRSLYDQLAITNVPSKPYILFFLNYQPEKTTTPMGGVFEDQLLAIRLLASAVPAGWQVLVKEHPRQFSAHADASIFRSAAFYAELAAMPHVHLVGLTLPTEPLLKNCQATATGTGSIGWQGLLQGKPTLNFGRSWYAACRSCYVISSRADVSVALQTIQEKGSSVVELDVLKFLAHEQAQFIIGGNGDRYVERSKRSPDQLAASLADAIAARLKPPVQSPAVVSGVRISV